ncbi:hypothetical protein KC19_11G148000 [Ceratodon purpureus]|uniref:2Fe-2S ferredoxin-type domain-containing protein n=1 Tax=Ceratodon purpureus TaxID=3225 RepID=A0A8T0GGJ5_CERPU|nr:hypothetical protein KC19_11G148000 [Ceratodon purpureus]
MWVLGTRTILQFHVSHPNHDPVPCTEIPFVKFVCELKRSAMAMATTFKLPCQPVAPVPLPTPTSLQKNQAMGKRCVRVMCMSESSGSIKRGAIGMQRFKESAIPGMYWGERTNLGEEVSVNFTTGSDTVTVSANVGDNLLRVAEQCGAMVVTDDFCFEGSCCHCEMEVNGGAAEVGYRAEVKGGELVRSCLCPVPNGRRTVEVNIINSDDGWDDLML